MMGVATFKSDDPIRGQKIARAERREPTTKLFQDRVPATRIEYTVPGTEPAIEAETVADRIHIAIVDGEPLPGNEVPDRLAVFEQPHSRFQILPAILAASPSATPAVAA